MLTSQHHRTPSSSRVGSGILSPTRVGSGILSLTSWSSDSPPCAADVLQALPLAPLLLPRVQTPCRPWFPDPGSSRRRGFPECRFLASSAGSRTRHSMPKPGTRRKSRVESWGSAGAGEWVRVARAQAAWARMARAQVAWAWVNGFRCMAQSPMYDCRSHIGDPAIHRPYLGRARLQKNSRNEKSHPVRRLSGFSNLYPQRDLNPCYRRERAAY